MLQGVTPPPAAGLTHDELLRPFARAILAKKELLSAPLSVRQRAAVLSSISVDIRKYCDAASPVFLVPRVSPGAASAVRALHVDLCRQAWQDQPAFDPGRKGLHLEHVVPVLSVRTACVTAADEDTIVEALKAAEVAWILKSEDYELSRLGYRSRRTDPATAYRDAGIELVDCLHA